MFLAQPDGFLAAIEAFTSGWKMSFESVHFLLFLPVAVGGYFALPGRWRRAWLLLASYYFYFFAAPKYLPVLVFGTLFSYLAGRLVGGAKSRRGKNGALAFGLIGSILGLAFFKYNGFFAAFLSPLFARLGITYNGDYFSTGAALGISFYTFTSIGYLIDVWRSDVKPDKNLLTHALFLGFFPSVTSGPISRAGSLVPQLEDATRKFDAAAAAGALRTMAIGFFKKLAVANTLAVYVQAVYASPEELAGYQGLSLTLAAVLFALQLYFDFSGYSDIALGAAKLLGIDIVQNFNTPYFATNFSGFWQRWHISLSTFLQDYIFTPLVWSRWTEKLPGLGRLVKNPPVLSSIFVVFFVSGVWHGDTLSFVIWGILQAVFRIGEELLHRTLGKPKKKPPLASRIGKTAVLLVLWVESLVFFMVGRVAGATVWDALSALGRQFRGVSLAQTGRDVYAAIAPLMMGKPFLVALFLGFSLVCLALALWADWAQCFRLKGKPLAGGLAALRPGLRWCVYYLLVLCCFAAFIIGSGGFGGGGFLYEGF